MGIVSIYTMDKHRGRKVDVDVVQEIANCRNAYSTRTH